MDTLKSLAVITLLGAVLYGVYVVASKPDKPLPESAQLETDMAPPNVEGPRSNLLPPQIETAPSSPASPWPPKSSSSATDGDSFPEPDIERPSSPQVAETEPRVDGGIGRTAYEVPSPGVEVPSPEIEVPAPQESPLGSNDSSSPRDADQEIEEAQKRLRLYAFHQAWKTAQEQVDDGRYREALLALTAFYNDPVIPEDERETLVEWLDALAAKVVYSTEHLIEPAYVVRRNETLYSISDRYQVPYLLLKNINGVRDPELLIPGTKLKVLQGPFRAEVNLTRSEITVFVQNMYAGRFPFALGDEPAPPGEYTVRAKETAKSYAGSQGVIPAKDPRNPYGGIWINLDNEVCIHGSPAEAYQNQNLGCIGLAQRDAEDLFAILSEKESTVVIKR